MIPAPNNDYLPSIRSKTFFDSQFLFRPCETRMKNISLRQNWYRRTLRSPFSQQKCHWTRPQWYGVYNPFPKRQLRAYPPPTLFHSSHSILRAFWDCECTGWTHIIERHVNTWTARTSMYRLQTLTLAGSKHSLIMVGILHLDPLTNPNHPVEVQQPGGGSGCTYWTTCRRVQWLVPKSIERVPWISWA